MRIIPIGRQITLEYSITDRTESRNERYKLFTGQIIEKKRN